MFTRKFLFKCIAIIIISNRLIGDFNWVAKTKSTPTINTTKCVHARTHPPPPPPPHTHTHTHL